MTNNEVLVIIGVGGMGVSVARRSGAGRTIVLADINAAGLESAAAALTEDGHHVVTREVDVTSRSSVAAVADAAKAAGRVTAVVHTAGLSPVQASAGAVLAVDLLGVALSIDEFGRVIEPGGAGVVIASMAGHLMPALDPDVERQLATAPAEELLSLDACSNVTSSQMAYPFAKRANQIRVAAAAGAWGATRRPDQFDQPGRHLDGDGAAGTRQRIGHVDAGDGGQLRTSTSRHTRRHRGRHRVPTGSLGVVCHWY